MPQVLICHDCLEEFYTLEAAANHTPGECPDWKNGKTFFFAMWRRS